MPLLVFAFWEIGVTDKGFMKIFGFELGVARALGSFVSVQQSPPGNRDVSYNVARTIRKTAPLERRTSKPELWEWSGAWIRRLKSCRENLLRRLLHQAHPRGRMEHHLLNGYTHPHTGIVEIVEALCRIPRDS